LLNSVWLWEKACAVIFQALRIEVNQEINNLSLVLQQIPRILNPGGRCTIISYHSTEDRLVKNVFKELSEQGWFNLLTKKAIQPNYKEKEHNKASRSAKMRVIERSFN
jgi:16S rRNA (cytosine1402-N4)-methyltransferase